MKNNILWPEIDDLWSAKKACAQASSAAFIVGAVTSVVTYMQLKGTGWTSGLVEGSFIDSAIFFTASFFIYRCSRIASVAGFVIYTAGQAILFAQTQKPSFAAILFVLFFIGGIRGAFAYHEMKKGLSREEIQAALQAQREESAPAPSLKKRITVWIILILLAGVGFFLYQKHQSAVSPKGLVRPPSPAKVNSKKTDHLALPVSKPLPGERVFKLKDGRTISGRVTADDPVYYTVETSGGRQEIIIKEDLAS